MLPEGITMMVRPSAGGPQVGDDLRSFAVAVTGLNALASGCTVVLLGSIWNILMRTALILICLTISSAAVAETVEYDGIKIGMTADEVKGRLKTPITGEQLPTKADKGYLASPPYFFQTCSKNLQPIVYSFSKDMDIGEFSAASQKFVPMYSSSGYIDTVVGSKDYFKIAFSKGGDPYHNFKIEINRNEAKPTFTFFLSDDTVCK